MSINRRRRLDATGDALFHAESQQKQQQQQRTSLWSCSHLNNDNDDVDDDDTDNRSRLQQYCRINFGKSVALLVLTVVILAFISTQSRLRRKRHAELLQSQELHLVRVYPRFSVDKTGVCKTTVPIDTLTDSAHEEEYNQKVLRHHNVRGTEGFFFIPLIKSGATTAQFVQLRVAAHIARRKHVASNLAKVVPTNDTAAVNEAIISPVTNTTCPYKTFRHTFARNIIAPDTMVSYEHDRFIWTMIREPTARLLSWYWYRRVSTFYRHPSIDHLVNDFLQSTSAHKNAVQDHYIARLSYRLPPWQSKKRQSQSSNHFERNNQGFEYVNDIINSYNFIGIVERYDESIVVYGLLLDLPLSDLLYLQDHKTSGSHEPIYTSNSISSSTNGSSTDDKQLRLCRYIEPVNWNMNNTDLRDFVYHDPQIQEHLLYWDKILYTYAVHSLDATIDSLGRDVVKERLEQYRKARNVVQETCRGAFHDPCNDSGNAKNSSTEMQCSLQKDWTCGQDCIDKVAASFNW